MRRYSTPNSHAAPRHSARRSPACIAGGRTRSGCRRRSRVSGRLHKCTNLARLQTAIPNHHPCPLAGFPTSGRARCSRAAWIRTHCRPILSSAPSRSHRRTASTKAKPAEFSSAMVAASILPIDQPTVDKTLRTKAGKSQVRQRPSVWLHSMSKAGLICALCTPGRYTRDCAGYTCGTFSDVLVVGVRPHAAHVRMQTRWVSSFEPR